MPRIFDNIEKKLLPALKETLEVSKRADFCVGYFNLRGWKDLDCHIEKWSGEENSCCRLLVGMQKLPQDELIEAISVIRKDGVIDNQTVVRLKKRLAEEFRTQLTYGIPSNQDESGLRRLAAQIKAKKVVVKLFLRHQLHAKLYLLFRPDPINPIVGYLGSSNLTFAGLSQQGELNIDVLDHDATEKLALWFKDRWDDRWCIDISDELVKIIEESWAGDLLRPPYHIYVKIAYHLSNEARTGLSEFSIPRGLRNKLFEFQAAAVKIAAHHLNKRGGVLIGDVVGLGKTLMATALAKIFEDDHGVSTLIICPKNLQKMWQSYVDNYGMHAKVLSISQVVKELPNIPARFRLVLVDESHNLRNREGKRFRAIQEYISQSDSKVILLSATPYNKIYTDLSNQLRLFIPEDRDLGIRPEQLLRTIGEMEFIKRHQAPVRSIAAFEKSDFADDWRELMRLYLVRRTRTFIIENYAETDADSGRKYLTFEDGTRSYFPERLPRTIKFKIDERDPEDQYARLYTSEIVDTISRLNLPRYGLGNYIAAAPHVPPTATEEKIIRDLSRAGKRLMGFCRTNLFKRLESSGQVFLQSIERHILRNFVYLYAIENGKPVPIGTQDSSFLDSRVFDKDADDVGVTGEMFENDGSDEEEIPASNNLRTEDDFKRRAAEVYAEFAGKLKKRFKWLQPGLFVKSLSKDLIKDSGDLIAIVRKYGNWDPAKDTKLEELYRLLSKKHKNEKVLVFTQFADTVRYLTEQLKAKGLARLDGVTGDSYDPTLSAWRFSPLSNEKRAQIKPEEELRCLLATDILSEGQNLQDAYIVINYDLPWAIIRLIQRAGRVDRIGQQSEKILCYSFLPADGVERIIRLRARVRQRLLENAEVVGADEAFFEDDRNDRAILDLYHEKAGVLDGDTDSEVDLASYAYQIWKNALDENPSLEKIITSLPDVVYATKPAQAKESEPGGVLVYMRTEENNDALAWIDSEGKSVTESQFAILKAAECNADTPALEKIETHHELVRKGVELIATEEKNVGGQLGRPSGARFKTYERLKRFAAEMKDTLMSNPKLDRIIEEIYKYPLRQYAIDTLNRQLKSGISDEDLARLVIALHEEERLCLVQEEDTVREPRIICSMGLKKENVG